MHFTERMLWNRHSQTTLEKSSLAICIRSFKVYLVILVSNPSQRNNSNYYNKSGNQKHIFWPPDSWELQSRSQDSKTIIRTCFLPNIGKLDVFTVSGEVTKLGVGRFGGPRWWWLDGKTKEEMDKAGSPQGGRKIIRIFTKGSVGVGDKCKL